MLLGCFSIPYVAAGSYTLLAHDDENGWARLSSLQVGGGINNAGSLRLIPGGVVSGRIIVRNPCPVPTAIVAVDSAGVEIKDLHFRDDDQTLMRYRIPHLWPGQWTVRLLWRETIIASTRVTVSGTEAHRADLVVMPEQSS